MLKFDFLFKYNGFKFYMCEKNLHKFKFSKTCIYGFFNSHIAKVEFGDFDKDNGIPVIKKVVFLKE